MDPQRSHGELDSFAGVWTVKADKWLDTLGPHTIRWLHTEAGAAMAYACGYISMRIMREHLRASAPLGHALLRLWHDGGERPSRGASSGRRRPS